MQREQRDDDAAWQAIVDNYGDRVLDPADEAAATTEPAVGDSGAGDLADEPAGVDGPAPAGDAVDPDDEVDPWDRFVPPTPPPLPRPSTDRLLSWLGVFGAPAVLLVVVVTGIDLPSLVGWFLVGAFMAGFGYLVATMPREPREPWDDGAQL